MSKFSGLAALLTSHLKNKKTFSNQHNVTISTKPGIHYVLKNVLNAAVIMEGKACKRLSLIDCRNIKITADSMPILGVVIYGSDGVSLTLNSCQTTAYLEITQTVRGDLTMMSPCVVEVNQCKAIMLNNVNISDMYKDSTWQV